MKRGGSVVDGELAVSGDLEIVMAKELRRQYAKRERADAVILFLESNGVGQRINFAPQVRRRRADVGGWDRSVPGAPVTDPDPVGQDAAGAHSDDEQGPEEADGFKPASHFYSSKNGAKKHKY